MLIALASAAVFLLQVVPVGDSTDGRRHCPAPGCGGRPAPRRIALTPEHLATAFRDSGARTLLQRAREARLRQDSALVSYEAMAYLRATIGVNAGRIGRERVAFRMESAARVRWHRDVGVRLEVKGLRGVYPDARGAVANVRMRTSVPDMMLVPYYPGQESLLIGWGSADAEVDEREIVHPLAGGAEAYYTYESEEAADIRLPDGSIVRLVELKVRPRAVGWNVVVGSLWLDVDRGQLARAAYRPAEPFDVWARIADDPSNDPGLPRVIRRMLSPLHAQISAVALEYGLHEGRIWLPRLQSIEGQAQATFARVAFRAEQAFRYEAVNAPGLDSMPAIELSQEGAEPLEPPDSATAAGRRARADSVRRGLIGSPSPCDTGTTYVRVETRMRARVRMHQSVPCDHEALARSPELPSSIYSANKDVFDRTAAEALIADALGFEAQPRWNARRPVIDYGPHLTRFNRIEGLSLGVRATQQLGAGFATDATLRFGAADREPNVELGLARTNLSRSVRIAAYTRLVAANDWGSPLSFGSSLSALLWGRDEGFYYRAGGIDLTGTGERGALFAWRFFAERQRRAIARNSFSFAKLARDAEFEPNIVAGRGVWAGVSLRAVRTLGLDPRGWRALGDLRVEAADGETAYGRGAADLTLSRALGPARSAAPLGALTLSAGSTSGEVPAQRLWYLGGSHSVRGHPAGAAVGEAYWFGRLELAQELLGVGRLALFGDAGWAGVRTDFGDPSTFRLRGNGTESRTLRGAGVGFGILDGLLRLDLARGVHPRRGWRADLRLEAPF